MGASAMNGPKKRATVTVSANEARRRFADLVNRAEYVGQRIVITRYGKPIAALVSSDDLALLEQVDEAA